MRRTGPISTSSSSESAAGSARSPVGRSSTPTSATAPSRPSVPACWRRYAACPGWPAPRPDLRAGASAYGQWAADLVELSKDFPLRQELLDPQATPDAKWTRPDKAAFWNDPVVRRLVERDVQRLANLRSLAARPRAELAEIARTSQVPQVVVHAWRLLGTDTVQPAWPTQEGDL